MKMLFSEGLGGGLIVLVIPGFFICIFNIFKKRITVEKFFVFLLPIILYFIWRYAIPLANLRYLYPALALGFIIPFMLLSEKKPLLIYCQGFGYFVFPGFICRDCHPPGAGVFL